MPGRLKWVCSIAGIFVLTIAFLFAPIGCGKPTETTSADQSDATADKKGDSQFAVPNGNPAKILEFIKELRANKPKFKNQEEAYDFTKNVQRAMIEAGDKILAQKVDDIVLREAATLKIMGTLTRAAIEDRSSDEFNELAKNALSVVEELRRDERPAVAEVADQMWVAARALNFTSLSPIERTKLAEDAIQNVKTLKLSQVAVGEASYVADQFVETGDPELAASMCDRLMELLKGSDDQNLKSLAMMLYGKARRLRLIGAPIHLEGKLLGGDYLKWESYRGKVVLIDFWATWCQPCVADLPNIKALYNKYHSQGFEVVAVSLDQSRQDLESFVKGDALPWPQLFDDEVQVARRQPSPMARKYSVSSIPMTFLVDAEGKVVSIEARGMKLERLVQKMLESVTEKANSPADSSVTPP